MHGFHCTSIRASRQLFRTTAPVALNMATQLVCEVSPYLKSVPFVTGLGLLEQFAGVPRLRCQALPQRTGEFSALSAESVET